jgi:phosphotransferase system enzyme I (PtsI)
VVGLGSLSEIVKSGDLLLLDGSNGRVVVNPGREERLAFEQQMSMSRSFDESLAFGVTEPCSLRDGRSVPLHANIDHSTPMMELYSVGAEVSGCTGRSIFGSRSTESRAKNEQRDAYTEARARVAVQKPGRSRFWTWVATR